jgi:hypothetical protein
MWLGTGLSIVLLACGGFLVYDMEPEVGWPLVLTGALLIVAFITIGVWVIVPAALVTAIVIAIMGRTEFMWW